MLGGALILLILVFPCVWVVFVSPKVHPHSGLAFFDGCMRVALLVLSVGTTALVWGLAPVWLSLLLALWLLRQGLWLLTRDPLEGERNRLVLQGSIGGGGSAMAMARLRSPGAVYSRRHNAIILHNRLGPQAVELARLPAQTGWRARLAKALF